MSDVIPKYRVVVMGKTGSGKSSACNRLIGHDEDDVFPVYAGMNGNTTEIKTYKIRVGNDLIEVVDTPDFAMEYNGGSPRAALKTLLDGSGVSCIPTAIIFTVPMDVRFNSQNYKLYNSTYRKMLPVKYRNNIIIGFTKVDDIEGDVAQSIQLGTLKSLLEAAKGRYVEFRKHFLHLLRTIVGMIEQMIKDRIKMTWLGCAAEMAAEIVEYFTDSAFDRFVPARISRRPLVPVAATALVVMFCFVYFNWEKLQQQSQKEMEVRL